MEFLRLDYYTSGAIICDAFQVARFLQCTRLGPAVMMGDPRPLWEGVVANRLPRIVFDLSVPLLCLHHT